MKVYLFMCERCGNAKFGFVEQDIWYTDCGGCKEMTFHNEVKQMGVRDLFFDVKGI